LLSSLAARVTIISPGVNEFILNIPMLNPKF